MPRPTDPVPGDTVAVDWATQLTDYISEHWEWVGINWNAFQQDIQPGALDTIYESEVGGIPANNNSIVAATISGRIIDSAGQNLALNMMHTGGTIAGLAYTTGVAANKGGEAGQCIVKVGGPNGRAIKWKVTGSAGAALAGVRITMRCSGYFLCEDVNQLELEGDAPVYHPIAAQEDEVVIGA